MTAHLSKNSTPNIPLQQLVKGIQHSKLLNQQIESYRNFIHPEYRFQVDSIIPILYTRIKAIKSSFGDTSSFNTECLKSVKTLSKQSKLMHELVHAIFDQINAADHSNELESNASKLCEHFDVVDFTIQRMYLVFMDETFEEYSTDLDSLTKKYKKLSGMLEEDDTTNTWITKQVRADQKELKAYSKEIELSPIKQSTISTYQTTLPIMEEIYHFQELTLKKQAQNPLISRELLDNIEQLSEEAQRFSE